MPSKSEVLSEKVDRVKKLVAELPTAASTLNDATDQLGKSIGSLDALLKKFSLGVPTWVSFNSEANEIADYYYNEDLGYAKIGGKWGVAVRTVEYNPGRPDSDIEQWLFNDAPRLLRVRAVEKIPELLEALLESAAEMSKRIAEKASEVDALTAGMNSVIEPRKSLARMTSISDLMSIGTGKGLSEQDLGAALLAAPDAVKTLAGTKARK
jgi:uncharacterized protein YoxC